MLKLRGEDKICRVENGGGTAGWMRHTLIWLSPAGRRYAASHIRRQQWEDEQTAEWMENLALNPAIPGILCRQTESGENRWICGFSHWNVEDGRRRRMLAEFCPKDVVKTKSPFDLCSGQEKEALCRRYPKLRSVFSAAENCGIELGLYGSTALEWVTGCPYRHVDSDFDLYVRQKEGGDVGRFGQMLVALEAIQGIRLDAELEICGYGIKLKELTAPGRTVIGKGLYDVRLIEK